MWAMRPPGKEFPHPGEAREKHVCMVWEGPLEQAACAAPWRAGGQEQGSRARPRRFLGKYVGVEGGTSPHRCAWNFNPAFSVLAYEAKFSHLLLWEAFLPLPSPLRRSRVCVCPLL